MIAFVCNAGWLTSNAMDGLRKSFETEFDDIYVFNLRGNQRTSGETSRREGGKIFGSGSRTPICITILVKKPSGGINLRKGPKPVNLARIHYRDIGDYLNREEKLKIVANASSALSPDMKWTELAPDKNGDWLEHGNSEFEGFIPLGDKNKDGVKETFFKPVYSAGLATSRDSWCFNFSRRRLAKNIGDSIEFFNKQSNLVSKSNTEITTENIMDFVNTNPQKFSWDRQQRRDVVNGKQYQYDSNRIFYASYRPFFKQNVYFSRQLNNCVYQLPQLFPQQDSDNLAICVNAQKATLPIITDKVPDYHFNGDTQCFPLYYYEEATHAHPTLMDAGREKAYTRKDGLTDFILGRAQELYGKHVTKEDIFYYVYGLLHSPDYRKTFAHDLKKSLPRLPLLEKPADFWAFSKAGRKLADLHLNYENQPKDPRLKIQGNSEGSYKVEKMRFLNKGDKSAIVYNDNLTITDIPSEAYEYEVNGKSAIEWIMERYQIKTDKASGILNDPNDWAREHDDPRYIFNLLISVITVSVETVKIIRGLPQTPAW